ncbi:hypothetical protein ZTR_08887 [Talaromyces verruculosus]|nr:hypothetical protein ZTR_08887 [Talaromyces verruculosus]
MRGLPLSHEESDSTLVDVLEKADINFAQPDNYIRSKALNIQVKGHEQEVNTELQKLQKLISDHLKPALEKKTGCDRVTEDKYDIFDSASRLMLKYGLSLEAYLQFGELLCGSLDLPVILLQIPKNYDCLKPSEEDRPLQWLEDCLQCHGLELRDVIVLDLLPMITDEWLEKSDENTREECFEEVCNFVVRVLQTIKPSIVISCQTLAASCRNQRDRWGALTDSVIMDLCSSISRAENQQVSKVCLGEQSIHVIQRIPPYRNME